jgi:hypothetical protein
MHSMYGANPGKRAGDEGGLDRSTRKRRLGQGQRKIAVTEGKDMCS